MIYFDNSSTTKVCESAANAAISAMTEKYGNPSSLHCMGANAERDVLNARKNILSAMNKNSENNMGDIFFTSGATESNNIAVLGAVNAYKRRGYKIVSTEIEHPSVSEPLKQLGGNGFEIVAISPRKDGKTYAADIIDAVDESTVLVSFIHVNNETGEILPAADIINAVKSKNKNTIIHSDITQSFCRIPSPNADILSVSGHKIHAPKGIGALYVKKGIRVLPVCFGGGQENGIRPGTQSVPLIMAFSAAVSEIFPNMKANYEKYGMMNRLLRERMAEIPNISVNSPENSVPYIMNFSVDGRRSEVLLHFLEACDIFVSSGSACSNIKSARSHVLKAMKFDDKRIDSAIRISFGNFNSIEEIDIFIKHLNNGINKFH